VNSADRAAGRLAGKVALITGTASGQGRAAAIRFAQEGARVVGCDLNPEGAEETVKLVHNAGGEMVSQAPVNMSDESQVQSWIDFAVSEYGDFDILYNNASAARFGATDSLSREAWDYTLANEITLIFLAVKHAVPVFRRRGSGCILNTASVAGMLGNGGVSNLPGGTVHVVTKAGVIALSRALAVELSPLNVRVNSISPGAIETPAIAHLMQGPAGDVLVKQQLIPRKGQAEDIVAGALYLVSGEASWVTGVNLWVDGGLFAAGGAGQPGVAFGSDLGGFTMDMAGDSN
jgi:NAD(P)-dependent dehydrogenase (short-subunit alcohol dehydrogenase family)